MNAMNDIHDSFVSLQQRVDAIQERLTEYAEHVEVLIAASEGPTRYDRELRALRANGKWRTPQQEERFQELTQHHRQQLRVVRAKRLQAEISQHHSEELHFKGILAIERAILIKVLHDHEGAALRTDLVGAIPEWVCNCTWEGHDHAEHVADMYEAELSQLQKGK